jgi:phage-related protein
MPAASRPLATRFFATGSGNEPVREWLKKLSVEERKQIGSDILAVQWAWPVGKPLVDSMGGGLWEIRSSMGNRIARTFFIIENQEIILLHGLLKKSRTPPKQDIDLARKRRAEYLKSKS